jgi:hypothetical protein
LKDGDVMGIERRGGNLYYYGKERVNGRVRSIYLSGGELAMMAADLQKDCRRIKEMEREEQRAQLARLKQEHAEMDAILDQTLSFIESLTRAALLITGHHKHKGQWRKARKNGNNSSNRSKQ